MASGPNASPAPLPAPDTTNAPEQQPDAKHDGAPPGPWFTEGELPSVAVPGGTPATTGGYSPDPSRTPQTNEPPTKAPDGIRR